MLVLKESDECLVTSVRRLERMAGRCRRMDDPAMRRNFGVDERGSGRRGPAIAFVDPVEQAGHISHRNTGGIVVTTLLADRALVSGDRVRAVHGRSAESSSGSLAKTYPIRCPE